MACTDKQRDRFDEIQSIHPPRRLPLALAHVLTLCALTAAILLSRTGAAGAAETVYYLGSLGQTTSFSLPNDPTYGQVNLACRTGWRFIQPTTGTPDWSTIDDCKAAAQSASAKWSLSIKAGADVPLWLYASSNPAVANSCTAGVQPGESGPGSGTLKAFQFKWPTTANFEYTIGSTQCIPVPWDTDYQAKLKAFIQAVWTHVNAYSPSYPPDHVVITGINSTTQENLQPYCTPASSTCGIDGMHSDVDNWVTLMISESKCTDYPSCASAYNGLIEGAYTDIIGYWGGTGGFPSTVNLASMFINSGVQSFPFNTTTTLGLDLLNEVVSYSSTRSIVMNNAAQNGANGLVNPIRCYKGTQDSGFPCQSPQPTSKIAFQEKIPVVIMGICGPLTGPIGTGLLNTASSVSSAFMETYPSDISSCL